MAIAWAPLTNVEGRPFGRGSGDIRAGDDAAKVFAYEGPGVAALDRAGPQEAAGVILESWTIDGDWFGDTWHPTIEEAKELAVEMWGADLGEWRLVPESVDDYATYVLKEARVALDL